MRLEYDHKHEYEFDHKYEYDRNQLEDTIDAKDGGTLQANSPNIDGHRDNHYDQKNDTIYANIVFKWCVQHLHSSSCIQLSSVKTGLLYLFRGACLKLYQEDQNHLKCLNLANMLAKLEGARASHLRITFSPTQTLIH